MTMDIIVIIALTLAVICVGIYIYLRDKTLEEIREDVYELFVEAENTYLESKSGKQKMKWVISKARGLLPHWAQFFISEELLCKVVQMWFDMVKDLLDDGKCNRSTEQEEE